MKVKYEKYKNIKESHNINQGNRPIYKVKHTK